MSGLTLCKVKVKMSCCLKNFHCKETTDSRSRCKSLLDDPLLYFQKLIKFAFLLWSSSMWVPFLRGARTLSIVDVPSFFLCFTTTGQPLFCLVSYKLMDHKMWKGISFCFGLGGKDYTYLCALAGALARDFPFLALGGMRPVAASTLLCYWCWHQQMQFYIFSARQGTNAQRWLLVCSRAISHKIPIFFWGSPAAPNKEKKTVLTQEGKERESSKCI